MSLLPTVLQSQNTYSIDAVQESNSQYYFALQGQGGGSTSTLISPVNVITQPGTAIQSNGITVQSNQTDGNEYGYYVNDVSSGTSLIQLIAQGDVGQLILGDSGGANNSYFVSGQGGTAIGNETIGTVTDMILWNPTDPALTLKLKNPTVITGPSGDGIPYDTIYNPLPPPTPPAVPIITSPTSPIIVAVWNADLTLGTNTPYTIPATGLYLVTASVRISTGVAYSFPAGSILNVTPRVAGTDDPYNSMTFFLSSTTPQGNINSTQPGLGFYVQGSIITGALNQASTGTINLGSSGGATLYIQQVINQNP